MAKPKALAHGSIDGDHVLVTDVAAANRLHNKSLAGTPTSGNGLRLTLTESSYCVASGWLTVDGGKEEGRTAAGSGPLGAADLVARAKDGRRALTDHLVYSDLRGRGFVARHAPGHHHFDVWPRGTAQGRPLFQVVAVSTADPVRPSDLLDGATGGVVCAVVDEDSSVTHYRLAFEEPRGDVPEGKLPAATGAVVADRVLVADASAARAFAGEFLGTAHGDGVLLSALEAVALQARGVLRLDEALPAPPAPEVAHTYAALRRNGVVVKSGFRFGAHLRGYVGAPDDTHAQWLLHCAKPKEGLPWSALSRGVRLAHGVRKQFLVAVPTGTKTGQDAGREGGTDVRFVHIAWYRP